MTISLTKYEELFCFLLYFIEKCQLGPTKFILQPTNGRRLSLKSTAHNVRARRG